MKRMLVLAAVVFFTFGCGMSTQQSRKVSQMTSNTERAIFAGGCFWGVEYQLQQVPGVIETNVGYTGGVTENPTYEKVCRKDTGHAEAVEVIYDPTKTDFKTLATLFFNIHDPTQIDGQGPDIGGQYRSEIFYLNEDQKRVAEELIAKLEGLGYKIATKLTPAATFWPGEEYHQDYYTKKGSTPYCHAFKKRL